MKMLAMFSIIVSLIVTSASHPMMFIILVSAQALMVCLTLALMVQTSWFSFILFLVFMGGLMVLFIYISSLASNENFNIIEDLNFKKILMTLTLFIFLSLTSFGPEVITSTQLNTQEIIFKIYSPTMIHIISMTMFYLLLSLIVIVSITMLSEGALRPLK